MSIDVLIVDDDRLNRRLLQRYIEAEGYSTRSAGSGEEALQLYADRVPDVVILDVMMPGIDGYETARRMKSQLREQYVPILMLSALTSSESITQGLQAGADDFLSKPYSREVLHSRLQAALRTKQLFNSLAEKKAQLQRMHDRSKKDQEVAERVMAAMIRSDLLSAPFITYRSTPAEIFNGDLLMCEMTPSGQVRAMLADFSGHGLSAAIGSQPVASIFRAMTRKGLAVQQVLQVANSQLKSFLPPELFLAVCIVEIDPTNHTMSVWNAGMPPVFVCRAGQGIVHRIASSSLPLGIVEQLPFELPPRLSIEEGDCVYLHSDGFTEAMNVRDEEFGDERLAELFQEKMPDGDRFETIQAWHRAFVGARPMVDDVTFVEIRVDPRMKAMMPLRSEREPDFCVRVDLGSKVLAKFEPTDLLERVVERMPFIDAHDDARLVLIELFNNAVDHGLLGLDSAVKCGPDGFERYYGLRDEALKRLVSGFVTCEVEMRADPTVELTLRVQDSGPGFDVKRRRRWGDRPGEPRLHGRGIALAEQLSQRLVFSETGNRVEATFALEAASEDQRARDAPQVDAGSTDSPSAAS